ncbi:MAG: acyl-CoA dehydrogenase family protein [Burkholderiaceae bacterium]
MIDFSLSDEERMVQDSVRQFMKREVLPLETELLHRALKGGPAELTYDELTELQGRAKAAGFWGIDTPQELGGADLSSVMQAIIYEETGKSFVNFKFGGSAMNVLHLLNDEQKKEYLVPTIEGRRRTGFALSEPGVGSDARGIRTAAVRSGNEWVINGEKTWITGGNEADFLLVFCRTPGEQRNDGVTAFLVDREMGWKSSPIRMMGAHDPASIVFENVRVPDRNRVGDVNDGFRIAMQFIYKNRGWVLGGKNVGAAERLLGMALEHAENRVTFGKKIAERENIQWMIAESECEIRAAKMMVLNCAWQSDKGIDYRHASCVSKFYVAQMANRVVDRVLQIHGGMGYAKEMPIEKWYRDLRIQRIWEGSDEMNLAWIFRSLRQGRQEIGQLG